MSTNGTGWTGWLREGGTPGGRLRGETVGLVVLLVLAVVGLLAAGRLPAGGRVVLVAGWLLAAVYLGRQGWLKAFGPVLFYDLMRTARRTRFVIIRTLYALLLAVVLCWLFLMLVARDGWHVPSRQMSEFATSYFYTFVVIQYLAVVLLTPPYTAGAISEEKERKTLEFLLATDLTNREIVLGKLVSRICSLTLLLLAGLPVLSFLQFLGGVDPGLVLASFAATAATMFSLAGLSVFWSVHLRRSRDAIVLTFLTFLAYHLLAGGLLILRIVPGLNWTDFPSFGGWQSPVTLGDLVEWLNAGNIVHSVFLLGGRSVVLDAALWGVLRDFLLFHLLGGLVLIVLAVARLRTVALAERDVPRASGGRLRRPVLSALLPARLRNRPPVGKRPMLWKELHAESGMKLNAAGRILLGLLVAASFAPTIIILWTYFDGRSNMTWGGDTFNSVERQINIWQVRFVGTVVACLLLLAVVVRASGSFSGEREKDTFDALMASPLKLEDMLWAKWVGAVWGLRWAWLWLGLTWALGVVLGGMHVLCVPLLVGACLLYAAFFAGVGLWFSIPARRTMRATVAALALTLLLGGGHWLLSTMCCIIPMSIASARPRDFEFIWKLEWGQTPPLVLGLFAFQGGEFQYPHDRKEILEMAASSVFGLFVWGAATLALWPLLLARFQHAANRSEHLPQPRLRRVAVRRHPEARP